MDIHETTGSHFFDPLDYAVFDLFGRPFIPSSWRGGKNVPWNCMADSRNRPHAEFITNTLPRLLMRVSDEVGEPSSRFATQNLWNLNELPALESAP